MSSKTPFAWSDAHARSLSLAVLLAFAAAACTGRPATVESDPPSAEDEPEALTEEDYYGTYDLYLGGTPITPDQPAPMTAEWTAAEFVAGQNGNPVIRTDISIHPQAGEILLWDATTSDVRCSAEGVYAYEDDGTTVTLELESDPCTGRAESADGARLVRPEEPR